MGYLHIENLYKNQTLLLMKEVYALEKIHGTSAAVSFRDGRVHLSPGGESIHKFTALFDLDALKAAFEAQGQTSVSVHGEAYGGSQQGMSKRYGPKLKFVVFDVKVAERWLTVPEAEKFAQALGLEFVHYRKVSTDLGELNAERDASSEQAFRNGVEGFQPREGIVMRPLIELTDTYGNRLIAKHKRDEERETATPRQVVDPAKQAVLSEATAIAEEWVTPMRLQHVLDKLPQGIGMEKTKDVIAAMTEDVLREGAGEIVDSREARAAIGRKAAELFKKHVQAQLQNAAG